ncbi:MAG: MarC family protein [Sulfuricella sp.]|nr:MarC family protein [Sulfuricella sp.]
MENLAANFVLLFIVIDPIGVAALFAPLTHGADPAFQRRTALRGVLLSAGILFAFGLGGRGLLHALGIGIPAFRIAGGLLLLMLSLDLIIARRTGLSSATSSEKREAAQREDISVFPLAFPLIAGPGALTTVLLMAAAGEGWAFYGGLAAVLAVVLGLTLAALIYAPSIRRLLGETGINVLNRLMGVILTALAVQYMLDGLKNSLFPG